MACNDSFQAWLGPLQARLMGAPRDLIECELYAAIREFYMQSHAWRKVIGPYDIVINTPLVTLAIDVNTQVVWVRGVWFVDPDQGTVYLKPATRRITEVRTGDPLYFSIEAPGIIRLWPTPDTSLLQSLWVDAALVPTVAATVVPSFTTDHHFEAILEGAMSRLQLMPNKPWTDLIAGSALQRSFRRRCMEFRALADQGSAKTDAPFRFPRWA